MDELKWNISALENNNVLPVSPADTDTVFYALSDFPSLHFHSWLQHVTCPRSV